MKYEYGLSVEWYWEEENLFRFQLSAINPMWTSQGSNPDFRDGTPATNELSRSGWPSEQGAVKITNIPF
jgi:hypothetical protein